MAYRFATERLHRSASSRRSPPRRSPDHRDCLHLSRTGLAEGRHGQGAGRRVSRSRAPTFDEADAAFAAARPLELSDLCFEGPDEQLTLTENTQPAILTVSIAACRVLAAQGIAPAFVAGHSLGEYSAHVAAGTFAFADAVRTRPATRPLHAGSGAGRARARWRRSSASTPAVVTQACEEAAQGEVVSPANLNGPGQVVIAGARRRGRSAPASARRRWAPSASMPLPVSAPFHCALMKPAEERLAPELRALPTHDPRVPVVANVDAEPKRDGAVGDRGAGRAGVGPGALGGRACAALRPRASPRMLRWVRARC